MYRQSDKVNDDPSKDAELMEHMERSTQNPRAIAIIESIVEYTADQMAYGVWKSKIKRAVSILIYGAEKDNPDVPVKLIAVDTFERVRKRARAMLRIRSLQGQHEAREDSLAFWRRMSTDPMISDSVRARARENLDKILCVSLPDVSLLVQANSKNTISLKDLGLDLEGRKSALDTLREAREAAAKAELNADAVTASMNRTPDERSDALTL